MPQLFVARGFRQNLFLNTRGQFSLGKCYVQRIFKNDAKLRPTEVNKFYYYTGSYLEY